MTGRYESEASDDDEFVWNMVKLFGGALFITIVIVLQQQWNDGCEDQGGRVLRKGNATWCIGPHGEIIK